MPSAIRRLVVTGMLASVVLSAARAQDETRELRVVTRLAPPIVLVDQGELAGFAIDIWNDVTRRIQARSTYAVAPDVGALLQRVRAGKADVGVGAISITAARAKELDFSQQILHAGLQIMVRDEDTDSIKGPDDLPGKRVATTRASTSAAYLRQVKARVSEFGIIKFAAFALLDGKVDAIVFDAPVLLKYATSAGKGRVRTVGPLFHQEDYGIVFSRNSPLREQVNGALAALREDGTYQKLYDKWFAE